MERDRAGCQTVKRRCWHKNLEPDVVCNMCSVEVHEGYGQGTRLREKAMRYN